MGWSKQGEVTTSETDLCIEGFQSSGNSFVFNIIRSTANINISHHCHTASSVKVSLNRGVETLILFRKPSSVILSAIVRFRFNIRECIKNYVQFYRYIDEVSDHVLLVSFEEAIKNTEKFIDRVEKETTIRTEKIYNLNKVKENVKKEMVEWKKENPDIDNVPFLKSKRESEKEKVRSKITTRKDFQEAVYI
jgi:hypothetical protein